MMRMDALCVPDSNIKLCDGTTNLNTSSFTDSSGDANPTIADHSVVGKQEVSSRPSSDGFVDILTGSDSGKDHVQICVVGGTDRRQVGNRVMMDEDHVRQPMQGHVQSLNDHNCTDILVNSNSSPSFAADPSHVADDVDNGAPHVTEGNLVMTVTPNNNAITTDMNLYEETKSFSSHRGINVSSSVLLGKSRKRKKARLEWEDCGGQAEEMKGHVSYVRILNDRSYDTNIASTLGHAGKSGVMEASLVMTITPDNTDMEEETGTFSKQSYEKDTGLQMSSSLDIPLSETTRQAKVPLPTTSADKNLPPGSQPDETHSKLLRIKREADIDESPCPTQKTESSSECYPTVFGNTVVIQPNPKQGQSSLHNDDPVMVMQYKLPELQLTQKTSNLNAEPNNSLPDKPYKCQACGHGYKSRQELKRHIRNNCNRCDLCGAEFKSICSLRKHILMHKGQKPYTCDMCGAGFNHKGHLNRHIAIHSRGKASKTKDSEMGFSTYSVLDIAGDVSTAKFQPSSSKGEKRFACNICGARFTHRRQLKPHSFIHTGERPHSCDMCDEKFITSSGLRRHMTLHTGERPYKCEVCNAKFRQPSTLKQHVLIHTGEKPYQCNVCDKRFKQRIHLKQHSFVHTGERPFKCDQCDASYVRKSDLNNHITKHTKERFCDKQQS